MSPPSVWRAWFGVYVLGAPNTVHAGVRAWCPPAVLPTFPATADMRKNPSHLPPPHPSSPPNTQFLSKAPSIRRSLSGRSAGSGALDGEAGGEAGGGGGKAGGGGGGPGTPERHARMSGMGRLAGVSTRSMLHAGASRCVCVYGGG